MPRESKANLAKRTARIIALLKKEYPGATTALRHRNPLQMLVATILSAQCTDKRVNMVTKEIFRKYKTARDFATAGQATLENEIRSTGFFRNKAKNIRGAAATIISDFDGKVPSTMAEILTLPGVARKTANVVLQKAFGVDEGIVVDTHVARLSVRLGFTGHKKSMAQKIERDLMQIVPKKDWTPFSDMLIYHGRAVCSARKPRCDECLLRKLCPSAGKV